MDKTTYTVFRSDLMSGTDVGADLVSVRYCTEKSGEYTPAKIENGSVVELIELEEGNREVWTATDTKATSKINDVLRLPSNVPDDYISSLVFNSGNKATTLSYPQTILFTGDDVIDNVFVPAANTTYNVMFWYDGINVNAVSRGVPYAQE